MPDVVAEQRVEGLGELASGTVFVDVEALEEGLVHEPTGSIVGCEVCTVAVTGEVEGGGQVSLECFELGVAGSHTHLDGHELRRDALLLALQEVEWQGAGVVRLKQFESLTCEAFLLAGQFAVLSLRLGARSRQFGRKGGFDSSA